MTSLTPEVTERATGEDRMLSSSRFSAFLSRLPLFAGVLPPPPPPRPRPTQLPQSTPKDNDGGGGSRTQRPGHPPPLPPPPPPPASSPLKARPAETCSDCGEISSKNASLNALMETLFEEYKRRERRSSIGRRSEDTSTQEEEEEEEKAIHCSSSSSSSGGGGRRPKRKKRKKKKVNGLHPSSVEASSPSSSSFSFDLRFQRLTNGVTAAVHSSVAVSDECLTDAKDRRRAPSRSSLLQQPLSYGRQVRSTRAADRDGLPGLPVRRTGRVSSRQFVPPRATGGALVRSRSGEPAASRWNRGSADRRSRSHDSFGSKEKRQRQTNRGPTDPNDPTDPTDPTDCSRQRTLPKTSLSLERQKSRGDRSTANRGEKQREEKEKAIGRTENGKGGGGGGRRGRGGGRGGGGEKVSETSVGSSSNGDVHWLRMLSISSSGRNSRPTTTNKRDEEASREKTQKRSTESNQRQSRIPLLRTTERQQLNTRRKTTAQQQHNSGASESDNNNNDTPSPLLLGGPQAIVISNDSLLLVGSLSPTNGQPEVERIPLPLKLSRLVRSIATRHLTQRRSVASASAAAAARGSNGSSSSSQSDAQWPY